MIKSLGAMGGKQERRGGIETAAGDTSQFHQLSKQERRGGIETIIDCRCLTNTRRKQERRGGIETPQRFRAGWRLPKKQERRGGIETAGRILSFFILFLSRNAVVALKLAHPLRRERNN